MLLILSSELCYDFIVGGLLNPKKENVAVNVLLTQNAVSRYANQNIQTLFKNTLGSVNIPPLDIPKIMNIEISLTNGKFKEASIEKIKIDLMANNSVAVTAENLVMDLFFELSIVQKTFPYLQDSGSLSLICNEVQFSSNAQLITNPDCGKDVKVLAYNTNIKIDQFDIVFKCGTEILLNSISGMISKVLKNLLNGEMGKTLGNVLISALADKLITLPQFGNQKYSTEVATDQRMIGGIQISEQLLQVQSSGVRCYRVAYSYNCTGDNALNSTELPIYFTNHDVQYQIEKSAFNSGMKMFVDDFPIVNNDSNFVINNIQIARFYNTGAQVVVNVTKNETQYILKYLENIEFYQADLTEHYTGESYYAAFKIRLTRLVYNSGLDQEAIQLIEAHFNVHYVNYDLAYNNADMVSAAEVVIYLNENWIHIGANFDFE